MKLFFEHSSRANKERKEDIAFALSIQRAAQGHPLAIALLAGEYDVSPVSREDFLQNWEAELASARREGFAGHHVTFTTAFERSYSHLSAELRLTLTSLSIFSFPFFAEGLAFMSLRGSPEANPSPDVSAVNDSDEAIPAPKETASLTLAVTTLKELTRRSLLEVDGWYGDDTPATYRFQPALRQEAARHLDEAQKENQRKGYAVYSAWFVDYAFDEIGRQPAIARLTLTSMSELVKIADHQPDEKAARYCWQLGTVLYQLGFLREADEIHSKGAAIAQVQGNDILRERVLFQQARLQILRGDLETGLKYLNECADLAKAENNEGEYSVILSEIANIHVTRGDLDRALSLYEESLQLHGATRR